MTTTMRTMLAVVCAAAMVGVGCDGGEEDVDAGRRDAGTPRVDSGTPGTDAGRRDAGPTDAGTPDEDAGTPDEDAGTASEPPVITLIEWEAAAGCTAGTTSDVTITVTVTDADTAAGSLTFTGSSSGCTGTIDAAVSTVSCPNAAPYPSTVTVMDPDGNSDTASFTYGICETGSVSP